MKKQKSVIPYLVLAALLLTGAVLEAADTGYVVIVNASNPASSLTKAQVSKFFLKKVTQWDSGKPVMPVELSETSVTREVFSLEIHRREISSIKSYWQQMIFAGRGVPPPEKASDAEVLNYIKSNPNAIGYVSKSASLEGVKVLAVQ